MVRPASTAELSDPTKARVHRRFTDGVLAVHGGRAELGDRDGGGTIARLVLPAG